MKKIIDHLKDNWIRHGFETLVVVVGVLIAFSLNNWNETLKERKKEEILLQQLRQDFETNQELIHIGLESQGQYFLIFQYILNHTGPEVVSSDLVGQDTLHFLGYTTVDLVYTTINPVISDDHILENHELKALLVSYPGIVERYLGYEQITRDLTLQLRIIHQKHTAILYMEPEMQTVNQTPHKSDFQGWLRDRDYQNVVVDRLMQLQNANETLLDLQTANGNILNLIKKELSRID